MSTSLPEALDPQVLPNPILLVNATVDHAVELSKHLLGEEHRAKMESGNHPDFHFIEPEGKSHLHPVATIHKLIKEVSLPPYEARSKIFVIAEAEKMLPPAANALLKTLEEPSSDTYFILLSDFPGKLLPTVTSRISPIQFPKKEEVSFDITSYIALAERREWDLLLDALDAIEKEELEPLLASFLSYLAKKKDPDSFFAFSELVAEGKRALDYHMKLKVVVLNLLLTHNPES